MNAPEAINLHSLSRLLRERAAEWTEAHGYHAGLGRDARADEDRDLADALDKVAGGKDPRRALGVGPAPARAEVA